MMIPQFESIGLLQSINTLILTPIIISITTVILISIRVSIMEKQLGEFKTTCFGVRQI